MSDAILIFTFSPIQSFIAEARRVTDLYVGSQILVQMAQSAAEAIGQGRLVYPAVHNNHLPDDMPNVLVARIPYDQAESIANHAQQALLGKWHDLVMTAYKELQRFGLPRDQTWEGIWSRQIGNVWQVFWTVAPVESDDYAQAYQRARAALDAVKHSRVFAQVEEPNAKDSLSGTREALHLSEQKARDYWRLVASWVTSAKLRPEGRERLDAIGATKRFCALAKQSFASTSTIASADFREQVKMKASAPLSQYRSVIEESLGKFLDRPRAQDSLWPYGGDLLFVETLKPERLEDNYGGVEKPDLLDDARQALRNVYKAAGTSPSPYYAVIVLDGDSVGEHISNLLGESEPEKAHRTFSHQLADFARQVPTILGNTFRTSVLGQAEGSPDNDSRTGQEFLIYNGGDDVLMLTPLTLALPMAWALAARFRRSVPGCHASAGIAIAHRLYPLDAVLRSARETERVAKQVEGKAAVAVRVIKRSGEAVIMRSKWHSLGERFNTLVDYFAEKRLSSRFAYDLSSRAHIVTALPPAARRAMLKQLVVRHQANQWQTPESDGLTNHLADWAQALDNQTPPEEIDGIDIPQGLTELARWVMFARFVAQGGDE